MKDSHILYSCGYFKQGHREKIIDAVKSLIKEIRPQFIPLIESFDIDDNLLCSSIGNSFGDIYETQLNLARNSKMNKEQVAKGFMEHIHPILIGKL